MSCESYCINDQPEHCHRSPDGWHEPDPETFHLDYDGCGPDGVYLDVKCKHCGQSGCVGNFKPTNIDWQH